TATADVSFDLSDASLSLAGDASVALSGVEQADLTGGASANTFNVNTWTGSAALDGLGAGDAYIVSFTGAGSGTVNIADSGPGGTDTAEVNGTAAADTIGVTNNQVTRASEIVSYAGLEGLTVNAGGGADTVNIRSTKAATPLVADGGDEDDVFNIGNAG